MPHPSKDGIDLMQPTWGCTRDRSSGGSLLEVALGSHLARTSVAVSPSLFSVFVPVSPSNFDVVLSRSLCLSLVFLFSCSFSLSVFPCLL